MKRFAVECENTNGNKAGMIELILSYGFCFDEEKDFFYCSDGNIVFTFLAQENNSNLYSFIRTIKKLDFHIEQVRRKNSNSTVMDKIRLPELDRIANLSSDYDDFLINFFNLLELKNQSEFAKKMIYAVFEMDELTYINIAEKLEVELGKIKWLSSLMIRRFRSFYSHYSFIMPLQFLSIIKNYRNYEFNVIVESEKEELDDVAKEIYNNHMLCMNNIYVFYQALLYIAENNMNSSDCIVYILKTMEMGIPNPYENLFKKIMQEAVNSYCRVEVRTIFHKLNYEGFIQNEFESFIRSFYRRNGVKSKVKLGVFLEELRNYCKRFCKK